MLCERCLQKQAHVHLTQTVNGKTVEKHLCESCALSIKGTGSSFSFSVHDFLKDTYSESIDPSEPAGPRSSKKCSGCGLGYDDYKRTGLFGCPDCYRQFRLVIMPLAKRIQGNLQHTGKIPVKIERVHRFQRKKQELQQALKEAVRGEAYERAAELRDQILLLEQKISQIREGS